MQPKKIAVIEDDTAIASMYQFKLSTLFNEVRVAHNGEAGLTLIEQFAPDLILLDILMPVMDGAEMLQQLRATNWGKNVRVIVLTNISRDEAPQVLRFLNVDRYVVKAHHTPAQVLAIVKEVLRV